MMKTQITFTIEDHHDETQDMHPDDQIQIIKDAIADGFRVPEETIEILEIKTEIETEKEEKKETNLDMIQNYLNKRKR